MSMSLESGLVLHCPLDQNSYNANTKRFGDKSPYRNHGTSNNVQSFTTDHEGEANRSCVFNGTSDRINCGNDTSFDVTDAITIAAWIYPESGGGGGTGRIVDKTYFSGFAFFLRPDNVICFATNNGEIDTRSNTNAFVFNVWTHVVMTYDRQNVKIYINNI